MRFFFKLVVTYFFGPPCIVVRPLPWKQCLKATRQVRHHKGEAVSLYRVYNDAMIMVSKRYDATV